MNNQKKTKETCDWMLKKCGEKWMEVEEDYKKLQKYGEVKLPYYLEKKEGCEGCIKDDWLLNKCGSKVEEGNLLCKKCIKKCKEEEGVPMPYGLFESTLPVGEEKGDIAKKRITWGKYLKKKFGFDKKDGLEILKMHNIDPDNVPFKEWITKKETPIFTNVHIGEKGATRKTPEGLTFHKDGIVPCNANVFKETGIVVPISWDKWSQKGKDKFVELYGELDENGYGIDEKKLKKIKKLTKKKEKEAELNMRLEQEKRHLEQEVRLEKMTKELEMFKKKLLEKTNQEVEKTNPEVEKTNPEVEKKIKKIKKIKRKVKFPKKTVNVNKAVEEAAEEAKKAEEEAINENGFGSSDDEESDMDDDAFVFNPFEYNGIKYHLEDGELYHFDLKKQELEEFGTLNDDGTVTVL